MPGKSKKIKEMGYEGGYPMVGQTKSPSPDMMKPYQANHPNMMKGHGKATKTGRPAVLRHMSS